MQRPVFIITGNRPHCGKSTVRDILVAESGLNGASCSSVVYELEALRRNVSVADLRKMDKESIRADLIKMGDWACGVLPFETFSEQEFPHRDKVLRVPSILIRSLLFSGYEIIDGVRRRLELNDAIDKLEWMGRRMHVVHVVRPLAEGEKPIGDNGEDLSIFAQHTIQNSGTIEELTAAVKTLYKQLYPAADPQSEFAVAPGVDEITEVVAPPAEEAK